MTNAIFITKIASNEPLGKIVDHYQPHPDYTHSSYKKAIKAQVVHSYQERIIHDVKALEQVHVCLERLIKQIDVLLPKTDLTTCKIA